MECPAVVAAQCLKNSDTNNHVSYADRTDGGRYRWILGGSDAQGASKETRHERGQSPENSWSHGDACSS
jgi:hypothetical protein